MSEIGMASIGNDGGAPVAQENENHQQDQEEGDQDGFHDFDNRFADIGRRIHADAYADILGQILLDLLDASVELIGDGNMIRTGLRGEGDGHHRNAAVAAQNRALILRRQNGLADIAKLDDRSVGLLDDQVVELFRRSTADRRSGWTTRCCTLQCVRTAVRRFRDPGHF